MRKIVYTLILTVAFGCSDFIEENPGNFIAPSNFYKSDTDVEAALIGVYDMLGTDFMYGHQGVWVIGDVTTDVATASPQASFFAFGFSNFTFDSANPVLDGLYQDSYVLINRANAVIENTENTGIEQGVKDAVIGQAKFLRALTYFNLVRIFGDVPLKVKETSSLDNLRVGRDPVNVIYEQILADLLDSSAKLPEIPVDGGKATGFAAKSLLGKVYLTLGQNEEAKNLLAQVIGQFSLYENYSDVFDIDKKYTGTESIFEVQYSAPQELNSFPNFMSTRDLSPVSLFGGEAFGVFAAREELVDSFTEMDLRRAVTIWENGALVGAEEIIFQEPGIIKYLNATIADGVPINQAGYNNFPVLRYSDVLLMFAEAEIKLNGATAIAFDAINQVRARAGLPSLSGLSSDDLLEALLEERKLELAGEGHRWFDLKRNNKLSEELSEFGYGPNNIIFPIPQSVIDANDQITQNEGY